MCITLRVIGLKLRAQFTYEMVTPSSINYNAGERGCGCLGTDYSAHAESRSYPVDNNAVRTDLRHINLWGSMPPDAPTMFLCKVHNCHHTGTNQPDHSSWGDSDPETFVEL